MKALLIALFLVPLMSLSQVSNAFNKTRLKTDQRLMIGLGSWATANFIGSGIGWATAPNQEMKSFHQMNVLWNTVNIALAVPGYFRAKRQHENLSAQRNMMSPFETANAQHKTEKIFLINSGLDIGYVSAGLLLRSEAKTNLEKQDQFNGFGNSLILQGGFLLIFDMTAYFIHNRHRKKNLGRLFNNIKMNDPRLGITYSIQVSKNRGLKL